MLYDLRLPKINPNMTSAIVECVYAQPGTLLKAGDKLFDLSVDLSSGYSQYCPPISYFRVVVREKLWLQRTLVSPGSSCDVGDILALFSTEADEPLEAVPARATRITTAGIAHHPGLWSASSQ
jgi:pyruvate/2-oxoglutarate dehydrogenase complex dihydrolipoamide acyltransferase (E2) component